MTRRINETPDERKVRLDYLRAWRSKNREKFRESVRLWTEANRDKVRSYWRKYNKTSKGRARTKKQGLPTRLRVRLWFAMRSKKNRTGARAGSAVRDLGCSIEELRKHLEAQFKPGMTWDNYGRKKGQRCWEIDHIVPLASFDLSDREQLLRAVNWRNLQPLWTDENLRKSGRR